MRGNENRETVADIVSQMRNGTIPKHRTDHELLTSYADRIDAAAKREREAAEADALAVGGIVEAARHKSVGNAAAMREALVRARDMLFAWRRDIPFRAWNEIGETIDKCNAALAAPIRNCDVGTAEEQDARFHATGEIYHTLTLRNALTWAQMPYTAEGGETK